MKKIIKESYPKQFDNYPRPSKMKKPDISGMTRNAKAYWPDLYIQDQAKDILIDKYGEVRGKKTFEGLVGLVGGAFYQAVTEVVMEKYKMLQELGEKIPKDYFELNYFAIWTKWMDEVVKKPYNHLIKETDYKFDFEDWDDSDINGPGAEISIDNLIEEYKKLITKEIEHRYGLGLKAEMMKNKAAREIAKLWIEKIKRNLRF
jgi:hypothetical protein